MILFFLAFLLLAAFAFCLFIIFLFYWLPKKVGYPRTGIVLSSLAGVFFAAIALSMYFEDELFTKNEARALLAEQSVILDDDFELVHNTSTWAIGDYYHTFTLKISEKDAQTVASQIKNSENFKKYDERICDVSELTDPYTGRKIIRNYTSGKQYIREIFEPQGKDYAPLHQIITIDPAKNELAFEDIVE